VTARPAAGAALATLAALAALAGCPGPSEENAPTVWLALDGRETEVKLIDHAPPPY
jgi:hypothetical protein